MFCEKCGSQIPDNATFCPSCGAKIGRKISNDKKSMVIALLISFLFIALGMVYAGERKKGVIIFLVGTLISILGWAVPIFAVIGVLIWAYGLYATYVEVKKANGEDNPDIIEDWKNESTGNKLFSAIVAVLIFLIVIGSVVGAFSPNENSHDSTRTVPSSNPNSSISPSSDSSSGGSSSGGSGNSLSTSSNGREVSSHYEGEYGSSDTHGKIYDDGSVESHQTGHTDYGDYKIDSYMDSSGNLHGTVDVGGRTYHVNS